MSDYNQELQYISSNLAADSSLIPVWDSDIPFPVPEEMNDLDVVKHIVVERARPGGFNYLHEPSIHFHHGLFYMAWANRRTKETGEDEDLIYVCKSIDAVHWNKPEILAQAPLLDAVSFNHPIFLDYKERLYCFCACWYEKHRPSTEVFYLNDYSGKWEHQQESTIPNFIPFCTPQQMHDGNWLMGGEYGWYEAAVAISDGNDMKKWKMIVIPRPESLKLYQPECAIINQGNNHILALCRPYNGDNPLLRISHSFAGFTNNRSHLPPIYQHLMATAPVSESFDGGHTWTTLAMSNFPLSDSKPFAGRLSTGQNYLLTNSFEEGRTLLTIAVTDFNGVLFRHIYKLRHQKWPKRKFFEYALGKCTEWSYPNAFEFEGNLYITYSHGKENCMLSIVPLEVLGV